MKASDAEVEIIIEQKTKKRQKKDEKDQTRKLKVEEKMTVKKLLIGYGLDPVKRLVALIEMGSFEPRDEARILLELMKYVYPYARQEIDVSTTNPVQFVQFNKQDLLAAAKKDPFINVESSPTTIHTNDSGPASILGSTSRSNSDRSSSF